MTEPIVKATGMTKTYPLGAVTVQALKGIDLTLAPGDFAVLLGPSGAGKTTTLNLLGCLDRPTGGELWVGGHQVMGNGRSLSEAELDLIRREHVGFVFTEFFLLPTLTALENVELPLIWTGSRARPRKRPETGPHCAGADMSRPSRLRARELLEAVGLGHRLTHRSSELSGGEMQRVAIARALINEPDLLLADEPTGNVDTRTRDDIFALLECLNRERGLTVLIATHDRELAQRVPRVIHLRDGMIVEGDADD